MANRVLCSNGCCLECDDCSKKSGSPLLCEDCLHRRDECFKRHLKKEPAMWASNTEESKANDGRGVANSRQVGGDHYRLKEGEQHWDRAWRLYGAAPFQYQITKYVERYKDKNGIQDLEKARHFIDKLIELESANIKHYFADMGGTACGATTGKGVDDPRDVTCTACRKTFKEVSK